jgi:hypothetical protein
MRDTTLDNQQYTSTNEWYTPALHIIIIIINIIKHAT